MLKFSCIFKLFYSHFAVLAVIKAPLTNPACTFIHKKPVEYTEFIHMPLRSSGARTQSVELAMTYPRLPNMDEIHVNGGL